MVQAHMSTSGTLTNGEVATGCAACAHPWTAHDAIAARFCNATVSGRFKRGCVCTSRPAVKPPG
jgi:hypothetical protein